MSTYGEHPHPDRSKLDAVKLRPWSCKLCRYWWRRYNVWPTKCDQCGGEDGGKTPAVKVFRVRCPDCGREFSKLVRWWWQRSSAPVIRCPQCVITKAIIGDLEFKKESDGSWSCTTPQLKIYKLGKTFEEATKIIKILSDNDFYRRS